MYTPVSPTRRVRTGVRLLLGLLLAGASGCGVWDEFRANDYSFSQPDPLLTLKESTDGNKRARAYGALTEPRQNGGSEQDQELVITLLTKGATAEPQAWCRLGAIRALSTFQDPRATQVLIDAYYRAEGFDALTRTNLRQQALTALGRVGNPAAVDLLVTVVKAPPPESGAGSEQDKQYYLDERIAAARALQNFKDPRAAEALVQVLKSEKDVALRGGAHESLQAVTGKELPPDAGAWEQVVRPSGPPPAPVADPRKAPSPAPPIQLIGGKQNQ